LAGLFEEIDIVETSQKETEENFDQFCEFVAEPAFETMAEELLAFGIKTKIKRSKGKSISFTIRFPQSRIDRFDYVILLPKNALELRLRLKVRGRGHKKGVLEDKNGPFMEQITPKEILKLSKKSIILDVIKHCRHFIFRALTSPD